LKLLINADTRQILGQNETCILYFLPLLFKKCSCVTVGLRLKKPFSVATFERLRAVYKRRSHFLVQIFGFFEIYGVSA